MSVVRAAASSAALPLFVPPKVGGDFHECVAADRVRLLLRGRQPVPREQIANKVMDGRGGSAEVGEPRRVGQGMV